MFTHEKILQFTPSWLASCPFLSLGISSGQTNSDIEALHQAYCHIEHSLGDTDEQKINASKMEITENSSKDASQYKEDCPKNTSTTESGKCWNFQIIDSFIHIYILSLSR